MNDHDKLMYMGLAVQLLSLKPELIADAKSETELIQRVDGFAMEIFNYVENPKKDSEPVRFVQVT